MTTALQLISSSLPDRRRRCRRIARRRRAGRRARRAESASRKLEPARIVALPARERRPTLVPSQQDYTIGSGADFDGERPITLNGRS